MARKSARRPRRKPNTGTIRVKRGRARPYEASFPLGHGRYRTSSFDTLADATAYLDALTAERDDAHRPRNIAAGSQGLHRFLSDWLATKKPHIKPTSYINYTYECGLAVLYLGANRRIDSITRHDAAMCYVHYANEGHKNVAQLKMVLGQAFEYALEEDYIKSNPFRRAKAPPIERAPRLALTRAQRAQMLAACAGDELEILWHLYSRLGLRRGEGVGLLWANVDFDNKTITITQQLARVAGKTTKLTPKTKRSRRTIPAPDDIIDMLRALQKAQRQQAAATPNWVMTGLVFANATGENLKVDHVVWEWGKLRKRAGLPEQITIHSLRHTAIHLLEDSGAPLSVVQAFAGHSAATMSLHYADHADVETIRAALGKMA